MDEEQYKTIVRNIQTLQKTVDTLAEVVQTDVKDISDLRTKVSRMDAQVTGLVELLPEQTKTIINKVNRNMDDNMQPMNDVKDAVDSLVQSPPPVVFFELKKINFFTRFFGKKGNKVERAMEKEIDKGNGILTRPDEAPSPKEAGVLPLTKAADKSKKKITLFRKRGEKKNDK